MPLRMWPQATQTTLAERVEVQRAARLHHAAAEAEQRERERAQRRRERVPPWRMTPSGELLVLMEPEP
jgi:hypothetical protein